MPVQIQADPNSALVIAWDQYQKSEDFNNALKWAQFIEILRREDGTQIINHPHAIGSLWGLFDAGFQAGVRAAELGKKAEPGKPSA